MDDLETILAATDADAVVVRALPEFSAWLFIALDDLGPGIAVGGTRLRSYDSAAEGLRDALRLAAGMTRKWAALGADKGGGKGVIALGRPLDGDERREVLGRYGTLVESLRGTFGTGPDLGITADDLRHLAAHTSMVHGLHPDGTIEDAGPYTAHGVRVAIEVALTEVGHAGLASAAVWIDGVGSVGGNLARMLRAAGARVTVSDIDGAKAERVAREIGGTVLPFEAALREEWDVFSPCAVGGIVDRAFAERVRTRIIAGAANDTLADESVADILFERGIVEAPDFIVNGGAAIALGAFGEAVRRAAGGAIDRDALFGEVDAIGERVAMLFARAKELGAPPSRVARAWVDERIAARRAR